MKSILITIGTIAVTFALGMLWTKGEDTKDKSLKTIAVVAAVALLVLAFVITGGDTSDD